MKKYLYQGMNYEEAHNVYKNFVDEITHNPDGASYDQIPEELLMDSFRRCCDELGIQKPKMRQIIQ